MKKKAQDYSMDTEKPFIESTPVNLNGVLDCSNAAINVNS